MRTRGIRVSVIEPAYVNTPFDANLLEADMKVEEYQVVRATVSRRVKEVMAKAQPPSIVAGTVLQAATAAHPRLRYTPSGLASRLRFLRRFAPIGLVDRVLRKNLRLET